MTGDVNIPQETTSLIRPLQRTFYSTKIPHTHYQLKNFISPVGDDIIYYASEHEIYALHLSTRRRETITSLPWKPQCLDARYGWICAGGPANGRCAFICVEGGASCSGQRNSFRHEAEVDALLPLDLDPDSRMITHNYFQRLRSSVPLRSSKPEVQIHELGTSIMNSVTIQRIRGDQQGQDDQIVCAMTNNDSTVRIFSLSQSRLISTLQFPTMMNHASISSDGHLLVAVGDEPKAFFCRRVPSSSSSADKEDYVWRQIAELMLSPAVSNDACFTTAFSPSGHVCAVAQQSGVITVFDTNKIHEDMENDDAVVEVLRSSRASSPRDYAGAVRSMSFSPAPWDLLAWAEDCGRVCVTDLRSLCRTRQTVDLDLDSPNLNRASVTDVTEDHSLTTEQRQLEIERRFLQRHQEALNAQNDLANASHVADYIELSAARRRLQRDAIPAGETNDLTESERQMLEFIRTHRPRENDAPILEHQSQRPLSVNYLHESSDPSGARSQTQGPAGSSNSPSPNAQQSRPESMRDTMRRSYLDRSRTADRSTYQPRRRGSVVISSSSNSPHESSSSHPSSLAPMGASVPTLSASPSRLASVVANTENVDWQSPGYGFSGTQQAVQDITDTVHSLRASWDSESDQHHRQGRERDQTTNAAAMIRLLQQQQQQLQQSMQQEQQRVTQQLQQERQELSQMMARVERQRTTHVQRSRHVQTLNRAMAGERGYENSDLDMLRRLTETTARREHGVRTMGIGWNSDGRNLYVATEEGILELTVNIDERKQFPSMAFQ